MDETSLSSKKRLKVIAKNQHLPLLVEQPKIPHITGCFIVSASGHYFTQFIIVPNKKKIKTLEDFENQCYLFSTESGWNTKKGFLYYSLLLISEISIHRFSLNEKRRDDSILLILDGATSHFISLFILFI